MKLTKLISAFILTGFMISCGGAKEHEHESKESVPKAEHHEATQDSKLSLNEGAKWEADEPTFNGMKELKLAIVTFKTSHNSPIQSEYNSLGIQLAGITKEIISKCSMNGLDHDQLHIVLAPMLANVDVIKNGSDIDKIEKNVNALSNSLEQFFDHFELK